MRCALFQAFDTSSVYRYRSSRGNEITRVLFYHYPIETHDLFTDLQEKIRLELAAREVNLSVRVKKLEDLVNHQQEMIENSVQAHEETAYKVAKMRKFLRKQFRKPSSCRAYKEEDSKDDQVDPEEIKQEPDCHHERSPSCSSEQALDSVERVLQKIESNYDFETEKEAEATAMKILRKKKSNDNVSSRIFFA